jgi:hypothetical protein
LYYLVVGDGSLKTLLKGKKKKKKRNPTAIRTPTEPPIL